MSKKKLFIFKWVFTVLAYIGLFAPISVIIIKNWNKYFLTNKAGLSVGMGGVLAILLVVLLLKYGSKKFHKVFWSTAFWITVICLKSIITDAEPLAFCFWLGTILFTLFEIPMNYFKKRFNTYVEETDRVHARVEETSRIEKEKSNGRV